jgi:catechol 2,3-dioxygenase-like lactoylglutathione lyase family enzyme
MTAPRFKGPAAFVADLDRSRAFYEGQLGLAVGRVMKNGESDIAVAYTAGFSIWLVTHAYASIFGADSVPPRTLGQGNWENTFETPHFAELFEKLQMSGAIFAHPLRELPWGQRGFRVYDPDGHIVDIAETHGALVRRLGAEGQPKNAIAKRVSLTLEQVDAYLAGED